MKWNSDFWNTTWNRPYGRYNKHHAEIWKAVEPFIKGKVVDLGCGPCVLYQGKDVDLTGVDFSASALDQARKNYPKGTYILADARETGLPDKEFDTCIMSGLLDYFEDWEVALKEARRITKKTIIGTLFHSFEGHDWSSYPRLTGLWHLYREDL